MLCTKPDTIIRDRREDLGQQYDIGWNGKDTEADESLGLQELDACRNYLRNM
jgi:hypothetical protein